MYRRRAVGFGALKQEGLGELFQRIRKLVAQGLFLGPGGHFLQPFPLIAAIEFAPVEARVFQHCLNLAHLRQPLLLQRVDTLDNLLMAFGQRFISRRRRFKLRRLPLQPAVDGFQQVARPFPRFVDNRRDFARQRVAVATPEVGAGLIAQAGFVFNQLLFEQHAGLKGIEAQHSLAEAVNGKHRRFVHLAFGQQQRLRGLGFIGNFRQQPGVKRVVGAVAQAGDTQLMDVTANTPAQLFGRRFGKGHHQQLFHADLPGKSGFTAQPQQQPQIERGNGKGFSGARRGFYQTLAGQGQAQGVKRLSGVGHSFSRIRGKDFCNALTFSQTLPSCGCAYSALPFWLPETWERIAMPCGSTTV